jgi:hypothetical protein
MSPCADQNVEITLDATTLLKLIPTLGSIQSLPAITVIPVLSPVAAIQPVVLNGCTLLTPNQQTSLSEWLKAGAKDKSGWKLAYQGSRDGFGSDKFHSMCDLKGESVTIIKSSNGFLFGGYSSVSWDTKNKNGQSENAPGSFIFTISNPHGIQPTKDSPIKPEYAIYHNSSWGPLFGANDMYVSSDCNTNNNSYTNFPYSYEDTTGKGNDTFTGSYYFTVCEIQVFTH